MPNDHIELAKTHLVKANDKALPMAERIEAYHAANTSRQTAHVGWKKIGEVSEDLQAEVSKTTAPAAANSIAVPKRGSKPKAAATPVEKKPLVAGRLHLRNAVQVALYTEAFMVELGATGLSGKAGKWSNTRPDGHAEPWTIAKVTVSKTPKDEATLGIDFDAPKTNYNLNDSNWVNDPEVTPKLLAIANAVAKKPMVKKEVAAELLDMKNIFGMRLTAKGAAAHVETETETAPSEPAHVEA